jgi:PNKP adenylyltransferase domain, ligase domain
MKCAGGVQNCTGCAGSDESIRSQSQMADRSIYLPPTISPTETTTAPDLLEHPAEAFVYYRREGVSRVICEQKHMGSRAAAARLGKSKALVRSP